jgi:hypothetical protein
MPHGPQPDPRPMPHVTQRIAVSEGLALGFALHGRWSIPFDTLAIHRAVVTAYLDWPQAPAFPQVHAELRSGLPGVPALTRADDTTHTSTLQGLATRRPTGTSPSDPGSTTGCPTPRRTSTTRSRSSQDPSPAPDGTPSPP